MKRGVRVTLTGVSKKIIQDRATRAGAQVAEGDPFRTILFLANRPRMLGRFLASILIVNLDLPVQIVNM